MLYSTLLAHGVCAHGALVYRLITGYRMGLGDHRVA